MQNISLARGWGRPCKQLTEPSYKGYPADGSKEEKQKWLKTKATEQWSYNILMSNRAAEYHESERKRVSAYNKWKKAATMADQPMDSPQNIMTDPREGGDGPEAAYKQEKAKHKADFVM